MSVNVQEALVRGKQITRVVITVLLQVSHKYMKVVCGLNIVS